MKIVSVILATFAVGFVAFQNCQKAPHPDDLSTAALGAQTTANKVDLQSQKIADISFNFQETETVPHNSSSYQLLVNKTLKVTLPSGTMVLSSDRDATTQNYCLTETLANELISILKSSQVCKNQVSTAPDQVCTQALKIPYAVLTTEKETYSLGGASDGCGQNSVDLCGDQVPVLKGFIASVTKNYKSFSCSQ